MSLLEQWSKSKLGKVVKIDRISINPNEIKSGTSYIGLEHINSEGQIIKVPFVEPGDLGSNKFKFTSKHLLYGKLRPYLKKITRPNFSGICSTDILPLFPSPNIDKDFLYYYLRQQEYIDLATTKSTGANLPRLSPNILAEFPIFYPPIAEQKRIAAILDKADAIRCKRQEAIKLTEELGRSLFLDMFGDPVTNPKGWQIKQLGEFSSVTDGTHKTPTYLNSGIIFLSAKNIKANKIDWVNTRFISQEEHTPFPV